MKRRLREFMSLFVLLLAAYAAMDLLSENYLYKATHKPSSRLTESTYTKVTIPLLKKDGTKCYAILVVRNVLGTGIYEIKDKQLAGCNDPTKYFILNTRRPDFSDDMEIGKDYEKEYNKHIPGVP